MNRYTDDGFADSSFDAEFEQPKELDMTQEYKAVTPDGWVIEPGSTVRSFRMEDWIYVGCSHNGHAASTGRVIVERSDVGQREFYPSVFNLKVVPK
jgi:hypothetical protein